MFTNELKKIGKSFFIIWSAASNLLGTVETRDNNLFTQACIPTLVSEQLTLKSQDIINGKECDLNRVFTLDLSETIFNTDEGKKVTHFCVQNVFPNLRRLELREATGVGEFLTQVFCSNKENRFYSLVSIGATKTTIQPTHLEAIASHFANYSCLIRDLSQYNSWKHRVTGMLKIHVSNPVDFRDGGWINGVYLDDDKQFYDRSTRQVDTIPLVISVAL